jgi:hypothetical protein
MDVVEVLDHIWLGGHLKSEMCKPNDGVQRRSHLVADVGHKLTFNAAGLLSACPGGGHIAGAFFHRDLQFRANFPLTSLPPAPPKPDDSTQQE